VFACLKQSAAVISESHPAGRELHSECGPVLRGGNAGHRAHRAATTPTMRGQDANLEREKFKLIVSRDLNK